MINAPNEIGLLLEPLPEGVIFVPIESGNIDIVLLFSTDSDHFTEQFVCAMKYIKPTGMIWAAWPKKAAKAQTNLDDNIVREIGLSTGLVDVKVCAIDDYWSGLKFVVRVKDRLLKDGETR